MTNLRSSDGFTIVELMIALSILSTILIMATVILIQIGALYSKGVNTANLQNTARTITTDVSSALQFSGNTPLTCPAPDAGGTSCDATSSTFSGMVVHVICINTARYSYVMDREQGTDQHAPLGQTPTPHVLWRDTITQNADCQPINLSVSQVLADSSSGDAAAGSPSGGYDMAPDHMRLTRFKVQPASSNGNIYTVDVWMAYGDSDLVNTNLATGNSTCHGGTGTQFCSVSQLSSTVARRIY